LPDVVVQSIRSADLAALIRTCGIDERRLHRIANELGKSEAPLVIAGASLVQTNSLEAVIAGHYLNVLLGGHVLPPQPEPESHAPSGNVIEAIRNAKVLLVDGENPVYSLRQQLSELDFIVSFGSFLDDTAAYADLLLPDHHALESEAAVLPLGLAGVAVAEPFVRPLYDTRPIAQTLGRLGVAFEPVSVKDYVTPLLPPDETWENVARRGGYWKENGGEHEQKISAAGLKWSDPVFSGKSDEFPLQFQPYLSLQFHDGRGANLPWMQELPDPVSSAMWGLPVEIDPKTADKLKVSTGDWLRVESENGHLEAPAYVHPAAIPGVVSMAIGNGHTHYGRYASGRGANPLAIVQPVWEPATGTLAFGATRVRVAKLERKPGELIQFSPQDKEQGPWGER
jgi:anaerobic selenocysteine-containing dehydrogenase